VAALEQVKMMLSRACEAISALLELGWEPERLAVRPDLASSRNARPRSWSKVLNGCCAARGWWRRGGAAAAIDSSRKPAANFW